RQKSRRAAKVPAVRSCRCARPPIGDAAAEAGRAGEALIHAEQISAAGGRRAHAPEAGLHLAHLVHPLTEAGRR
ncbi:MAG: hypothetical protein PVH91_09495, partial [Pseudomonadales bacterium]